MHNPYLPPIIILVSISLAIILFWQSQDFLAYTFLTIVILTSGYQIFTESRKPPLETQDANNDETCKETEIISQVISLVEAEFILANNELEKITELVSNAGRTLAGNFTGLQQQSISQKEFVRELVKKLDALVHNEEDMSSKTNDFSRRSQQIYQRMADSLETIKSSCNDLEVEFTSVSDQIESINKTLDDLNSITDQTNLLALNAAIEAARAGDVGRGFAVVADEVRTLSQRSQSFNFEIAEQVKNIRTAVDGVSSTISKLSQIDLSQSLEMREQINDMWSSMQSVVEQASSDSGDITQLAESIGQQAQSGVVSLQFEDIVQQLMGHLKNRLTILNSFTLQAKAMISKGLNDNRVKQLNELITQKIKNLDELHSSVSQQDTDSGGVDLF
ncbi:methyl-accepting chemotaxis protein [Aliikangiella coralliicola]|uniref:Methyl-accepting transducer domain-containing protein n=1 Tax=Aliikangiella coralliicola TaxID=2592383 RepID=A0A545UFD2_9GAMM|nr:methyl-accepting chemotaxis protein [Aliikangiella coralliicola]TQV88179.1 hypothetical protein FLL46_06525 [Aliikangiella coralliicola]